MSRNIKGNWKLFKFLSISISLIVLFVGLEKVCQDIFKLDEFYSWGITLGLIAVLAFLVTFHQYSQCIFMLTIPQIISKRGRMFLIATAFLISLSGPTKNLLRNGEILSESLSCSQVKR